VISPSTAAASSSSIASSFSSGDDVGRNRLIAANPACTDFDGMTRTVFSLSAAACSAVRTTFELFGRTRTVSVGTASIASRMSAADGFIDCPPSMTRVAPRLSNSRRLPRPGQTATRPVSSVAMAGALSRSRSSRCAVCTCMFAISTPSTTPSACARA
jgi:hypothetical protein